MFFFGEPKNLAPKMVVKSTFVLQNNLINFDQPQFQTAQTENSK